MIFLFNWIFEGFFPPKKLQGVPSLKLNIAKIQHVDGIYRENVGIFYGLC